MIEEYDEYIKQYAKLMTYAKKSLYKLHLHNKTNYRSKEDIDQLVNIAAWKAYELVKERNQHPFPSYFFNSLKFLSGKKGMCGERYNFTPSIPANFDRPVIANTSDEDNELIEIGLGTLSDIQRQVIRMRFYEDKTLQQSGDVLGLTGERIRQIQDEAITIMKRELSNYF